MSMYDIKQIIEECEDFQLFLKTLSLGDLVHEDVFQELNKVSEMILIRYESLQYEAC